MKETEAHAMALAALESTVVGLTTTFQDSLQHIMQVVYEVYNQYLE